MHKIEVNVNLMIIFILPVTSNVDRVLLNFNKKISSFFMQRLDLIMHRKESIVFIMSWSIQHWIFFDIISDTMR